jgi:ABC-2 type transport system permease protein
LWLRRVADWNPFFWATSALRALFAGHLGQPVVWQGLLVVASMTCLAVAWSARLFARSLR